MKPFILEINTLKVFHIVKSLHVTVVSRYTKIMLKRNPTNIIDVINHVYNTVIFEYIKDHILKKKLMNVINVVMPFKVNFKYVKEYIYILAKPSKCNQCDKTFLHHSHFQRHAKDHSGEKLYGYT